MEIICLRDIIIAKALIGMTASGYVCDAEKNFGGDRMLTVDKLEGNRMSARLKLKKLRKEIEFIQCHCKMREHDALCEKLRCNKLLKENIREIQAYTELGPSDTMRCAVKQLDYSVYKVTDAIVRKYTEQLAEYVRNQLINNYRLVNFSTVAVSFLAPALNEEHIKVEVNARHKY